MKHIEEFKIPKAVIYTDSLSSVKSIATLKKHKNPAVVLLYSLFCTAYKYRQYIMVSLAPGHRAIQGNVMADQLAQSVHVITVNTFTAIAALDLEPFLKI